MAYPGLRLRSSVIAGVTVLAALVLHACAESAAPIDEIPQIAWPLDYTPSSFDKLDHDAILTPGTSASLQQVADRLDEALEARGFHHRRYYGAPGGFAIVTALERTEADGRSHPDPDLRWSAGKRPPLGGLGDYFGRLFGTPAGEYRSFVFVVTTEPAGRPQQAEPPASAVKELYAGGALDLPQIDGDFTAAHLLYVAVYEYDIDTDYQASDPLERGRGVAANLDGAGLGGALCCI